MPVCVMAAAGRQREGGRRRQDSLSVTGDLMEGGMELAPWFGGVHGMPASSYIHTV